MPSCQAEFLSHEKRNQLAYEAERMRARLAVVGDRARGARLRADHIRARLQAAEARACRQLLPSNPGIDTTLLPRGNGLGSRARPRAN
jgi:hypothetical protein